MHFLTRSTTLVVLALAMLAVWPAGVAADASPRAAFIQTNDPSGNQVIAYDRAADGTLSQVQRYDTGGLGQRVEGSTSDSLASQGSLVFDSVHSLLIGVNAGSNSVYAFQLNGDRLSDRVVVASGGTQPVSVAVSGALLYVLNAGGTGNVAGFRIAEGHLVPIPNSSRSLDLTPATGPTAFLMTPGQIGFTPDRQHLIVTTKANGSHIDVFQVESDGRLSDTPVTNASTTPVPFAFTFDPSARLVVGEAGTSNVSTYVVNADGTLTGIATLTDGQAALCWVARDAANQTYYVTNTGSGTLSGYHVSASGQPSLVGASGIVASPQGGPIDLATAADGSFVYAQLGVAGSLAEFRANADGTLSSIGAVQGQTGMEGIVAF